MKHFDHLIDPRKVTANMFRSRRFGRGPLLNKWEWHDSFSCLRKIYLLPLDFKRAYEALGQRIISHIAHVSQGTAPTVLEYVSVSFL